MQARLCRRGHAFVLDGLDERGMFHVNWGTMGNLTATSASTYWLTPFPQPIRRTSSRVAFSVTKKPWWCVPIL
ncbi:MAG: C10 family peptidase [Prevotellamassilia sp.]